MFDAEDLSPVSADRESGGHDDIVTTAFREEWPSISVAVDVGSAEHHSLNGIQHASVYDEENQYHPTPDEVGALALTKLASAAASREPRIDDNVAGITPPITGTSADHFHQDHRPDPKVAFEECDFTDHESVNKWYPPYKNRGTYNCPYSLIGATTSRLRQREIVIEWRMLAPETQRQKMEEIFARQRQQQESERQQQIRASQMTAASASAEPAHNYNTRRHRPAPLAAINNNSNGSGGGASVQQSRRRNNNESTTARPTTMNGLLDGGDIAVETSAALAARTNAKSRTVDQPPKTIQQLNDRVVNRRIASAEMAAMRVAEVAQPPSGVDFGEAITATITITITNVKRTDAHGKRADLQIDEPVVTIISPAGRRALELALPALSLAIRHFDDSAVGNNIPTSPVKIRRNAVLITNEAQMKKYQGSKIRRKALPLTDSEIDQAVLGPDYTSFDLIM